MLNGLQHINLTVGPENWRDTPNARDPLELADVFYGEILQLREFCSTTGLDTYLLQGIIFSVSDLGILRWQGKILYRKTWLASSAGSRWEIRASR